MTSKVEDTLVEMKEQLVDELSSLRKRMEKIDESKNAYEDLDKKQDDLFKRLDATEERLSAVEAAKSRLNDTATDSKEDEEFQTELKSAFRDYVMKGREGKLEELLTKTMSIGSDPEGGYTVPAEVSGRVIDTVKETSLMRPLATVQNTSRDRVTFLVDKETTDGDWTPEGTDSSPNSTTPTFGEIEIPVHKLTAQPAATIEMIMDSDLNVESWLGMKGGQQFGRIENDQFINGTGTKSPRGILTYAAGTSWEQVEQVETATASVIAPDDLVDMIGALKSPYLANATWGMSRGTETFIRKLKDDYGRFFYDGQDMMNRTLHGYPIARFDDMVGTATSTTFANNALAVVFGDFRQAYTILDRAGITILRDPYTSKGNVLFYMHKRTGGGVVNFEAYKILKIKST